MTAHDRGLSRRASEIVSTARVLLEEEGLEALSMRNLAERLGIRAPSLYKHFAGKPALEAALISIGFEEQADLFEAAVRDAPRPMLAMAAAYRDYARAHPHLYRLMYERGLDRALLSPGSEQRAIAPAVRAAGGDPDLARAAWAFGHGMTILELNGRFPDDADLAAAWERGIEALQPPAAV